MRRLFLGGAGGMAAGRYPEIYVLRHGETEWNAEGRMQGRLHSPLTPTGMTQAARQAEIMNARPLDGVQIIASPQTRALHTAAIVFARSAGFIRTDDRLCEIDVGRWQGRLRCELKIEGDPQMTPDGPIGLYERADGGEGFDALRLRCEAFLDSLTSPTAIVTHGITSRMLRAVYLGLENNRLAELPGGQGVVHHLQNGVQEILS